MVIDSGSDILWVQWHPCNQCYRQTDPIFNPSQSASLSFSAVSCSSSVCSRLQNTNCSRRHHSDRRRSCPYQVQYSDDSSTKGTLAFETLTDGSTTIRNVAIGCGPSPNNSLPCLQPFNKPLSFSLFITLSLPPQTRPPPIPKILPPIS